MFVASRPVRAPSDACVSPTGWSTDGRCVTSISFGSWRAHTLGCEDRRSIGSRARSRGNDGGRTDDDPIGREVLPIPDRQHVGLTTYDAKDPATKFPPIRDCVRPTARRTCSSCSSTTSGSPRPAPSAARRHAERRAPRGRRSEVQPVPHDRPVLADAGRAAERAQPPHRRDGRHHRDRHLAPGYNSIRPNTAAPLAEIAQAQRLQHRAVRQVPRGAGLADQPDGTVRQLADRVGLRALLRVHRRRDQPVRAGDLPATRCRSSRTGPPEEGYHFTEDMTDHAIDWIRQQKALMARQAVLHVLRAGATHAPHHVPGRVVRQVQGQVRRRLGRAARADVRPSEGARRHPGGRRADGAARRDPRLGRHA